MARHFYSRNSVRTWLVCAAIITTFGAFRTSAQDSRSALAPAQSQSVSAMATADGVRFAAPNTVVQLRVEIFNDAGQKLFDNEQAGGNVIDWKLQSTNRGPVIDGNYLCVVTVKDVAGKISQRLGAINVNGQLFNVHPLSFSELNISQAQAVGPIDNSSEALTVLSPQDVRPITSISNTGDAAQLGRTRGDLTFRVGDLFSGNDKEQMRLTEEGNLGVGTAKPEAKLDVSGTVRAREGFEFGNGSRLGVNDQGALTLTNSNGNVVPNISGSGIQDRLAKWLDNSGTLGNSFVSEAGNTGLKLTAAPSSAVDTNLIFLNSTNATTGVLAGSTPFFSENNGPFFAMRGNAFTTIPNQRGLLAIAAGNVSSPVGDDGSLKFATGNDLVRMVIRPSGRVGLGVTNPLFLFDVGGDINTSTNFNLGGNRALSNAGVKNLYVGVNTGPPAVTPGACCNTFVGTLTGQANTSGTGNSFFGDEVGSVNTTGSDNSFFGLGVGIHNTTGSNNSFFGAQSGIVNSTSSGNSFFGFFAGNHNTGNGNSFFGNLAGDFNTVASQNSFFGEEAGFATTSGFENSFFGNRSGFSNTTGTNNSTFGSRADVDDGLTNATAIGFKSFVAQSNSLVLGSISGVNGAIADTKVGIGTTTPAAKLHIAVNSGRILLGDPGCNPGFTGIGFAATLSGCTNYSLLGNGTDTIINSPSTGNVSLRRGNIEQVAISSGSVSIPNIPLSIGSTLSVGSTSFPNKFYAVANVVDNDGNPSVGEHVALIENTKFGRGQAVLALKIGDTVPIDTDNFVTFYDANNLALGAIEGNGSGGVSFATSGGDYAEWLPRINRSEKIQAGEIVGLYGGRITKNTRGASEVMVVSTGPSVSGNDPGSEARSGFDQIVFIGQVKARVRGPVKVGDFIIPSGLNDGIGIAISPEQITSEQFEQVAGQAWETVANAEVKSVRIAVGLIRHDPTIRRLLESNQVATAKIESLANRLSLLEGTLAKNNHNQHAAHRRTKGYVVAVNRAAK